MDTVRTNTKYAQPTEHNTINTKVRRQHKNE